MRQECKPSLCNQSSNTRPVEEKTRLELFLHLMPVDVVHDEGEGVEQCENEEGVGDPAVEDLEALVAYAGDECYPIRLGRGGTAYC